MVSQPLTTSRVAEADGPWPLVLIILDGLGDVPARELDGRTPLEAAPTPHLDRLAAQGANGLLYPLRPGLAPSTERAHWDMFGYDDQPFPGRAALEALGRGHDLPPGATVVYALLRRAERRDDGLYLLGRHDELPDEQGRALWSALGGWRSGELDLLPVFMQHEQVALVISGPASGEVTDSDPFPRRGPVLRVRPCADARDAVAAARTAEVLHAYIVHAHRRLRADPRNLARRDRGESPVDLLVTKWAGTLRPVPSFRRRLGLRAAMIASTSLSAGFARLFDAAFFREDETGGPEAELGRKLAAASACLAEGYDFVYVHTKAADEAAHSAGPAGKACAIAALDRALALVHGDAALRRGVVAVTADHCTPSWGPWLHSGDAVPLAVRAPGARVDGVTTFGERAAAGGSLGTLRGADLMPLLLHFAGRPAFLGARPTPEPTLGVPVEAEPFLPEE